MGGKKEKVFGLDRLLLQVADQREAFEEKEKGTTGYIKRNLVIYEELKHLVPPLSEDELHKLEISIRFEGCRDPLVVWCKPAVEEGGEEEWVLIDGHNRYQICEKHNIEYNVASVDLPDYETVMSWVVNNQLGKRNATEETKSYLRGLQYHREKKKEVNWQNLRQYANIEKDKEKETPTSTGSTAERLGELHKVSEKTIKRDEKYALAIDRICGDDHTLKSQILQKIILVPKLKLVEMIDDDSNLLPEIGLLLAQGSTFIQAYDKLYPSATGVIMDYDDMQRAKRLNGIKNDISKSLKLAINTRDKNHIATLRRYLEDLEKNL